MKMVEKVTGELDYPVRRDAPVQPYPWRDNAYLVFWDSEHDVLGSVRVSTSPNARGRRARATVAVRGSTVEVIEDLDPGTFAGELISFDLDGRIDVRSPRLKLELDLSPRGAVGDYTATEVLPPVLADRPPRRVQQGAAISGFVSVQGERGMEESWVGGVGLRGRTWGFRDESTPIPEYVACMVGFSDVDLTVLKVRGQHGRDRMRGFALSDRATELTGMSVTRDAAGLVVGLSAEFADGRRWRLRRQRQLGGFWVPIGEERSGPTMSAYDEFVEVRADDGRIGYGMIEQGIRRQLW